eukprot:scaffold3310_cov283-Chaetoceros_neogracile.AAC.30
MPRKFHLYFIWLFLHFFGYNCAHAFLVKTYASFLFQHRIPPCRTIKRHGQTLLPPPPGYHPMSHVALNLSQASRDAFKDGSDNLDDIEKIYIISDLHTDNAENLEWLKLRCASKLTKQTPGDDDCLIIAGDISHELSKLKETLSIITENLHCHVFFIWGNHEAWIGGQEMNSLGIQTSLEKIDKVKNLCYELGIHTDFALAGKNNENPVILLPIESWYDATLSLEGCEDLCQKFNSWPWVDFLRCVWPKEEDLGQSRSSEGKRRFTLSGHDVENTGRIPLGLTEWFANKNEKSITDVQDIYHEWLAMMTSRQSERIISRPPGLITMSHFLPNEKTLPDWKDPNCETFKRNEWLDHPVPDVSAKFAKVAGSSLIDEQIRSIVPLEVSSSQVQHLHVFGHSHRPKDFVYKGIRYVHNPLGKPAEREMNMVSDEIDFQLVWDCCRKSSFGIADIADGTLSYSGGLGEIPGDRVIRFWEEKGGGKELLARNMKHRRQRQRIAVKRLLRDLK